MDAATTPPSPPRPSVRALDAIAAAFAAEDEDDALEGRTVVIEDPSRGRTWRRSLRRGDTPERVAAWVWDAFGRPDDLTFRVEPSRRAGTWTAGRYGDPF